MATPTVDTLVELAQQLSGDEQEELIRRLETLHAPRQRPSKTLKVFHVDQLPENLTLRREDEYGDDER
jgi:hypothetical protein